MPLPRTINNGAKLIVARYETVADGDVLRGPQISKRKAGLRTDTIVPRRNDAAVRYTNILAAVDVHAVPVGIDFEVVDGQVIDSGKQKAEVASPENREVPEDHIVAVLESNGLVAHARLFGSEGRIVPAG